MAGLNQEIWIADLIEQFLPETSFLAESTDMSMWIENDKINLAEAGITPDVLINNTTFPVPINDRTDTPLALELNMYDTVNTRLRRADQIELAYDKRASVIRGHQNALRQKLAAHAAWSWTPSATDAYNKVKDLTGNSSVTFNDIIDLSLDFDNWDAPEGSRILVLNPNHQAQLQKNDLTQYKAIWQKGQGELYGFKVYKTTKTSRFSNLLVKKPFGSANASNDVMSSFAYVKEEVMTAIGTVEMFDRLNDPEARADVLGFQMRALALPIRNKYSCAILK